MNNEEAVIAAQTQRQLELINSAAIGTCVGVAYSYIVIEQVDPHSTCPAMSARCWSLVAALGVSGLIFVFLLPVLTLLVVRAMKRATEGDTEAREEDTSEEMASFLIRLRNLPKAVLFQGKMTEDKFIQEFSMRVQRLTVSASHAMVSVTNYNLIYYLFRQVYLAFEHEETSSANNSFSSPAERENDSYSFILVCFCIALAFVSAYITAILVATSKLQTADIPYWTELRLLVQESYIFPLSYALLEAVSLIFFTPFAFGANNDNVRAFELAFLEFVLVLFATRQASRAIYRRLDLIELQTNLPNALTAALGDTNKSYRDCALVILYNTMGVITTIGFMQALTTLLSVFDITSNLNLFLFFIVWAPMILLVAVCRTRFKRPEASASPALLEPEQSPPSDETPFLPNKQEGTEEDEKKDICCSPGQCCNYMYEVFCTRKSIDVVFEDTLEKWLVSLAWWQVYKNLLMLLWDYVDFINISTSSTFDLLVLARFFWQLLVAFVVTVFFAAVPTVLILLQESNNPDMPHAYLQIVVGILTCDSALIGRLRGDTDRIMKQEKSGLC